MRNYIIRPLFIQAGIISKDDHEDRLLFYTDLEATFYYLQRRSINMDAYSRTKLYEEGKENILCRISSDKKGTLSLNLDVISPKKSTLNVQEVFLEPISIRSSFVSSSLLGFKENIRNFIESAISTKSNDILDLIIDHVLNYFPEKTVNMKNTQAHTCPYNSSN
ncbi:MAG: hypothetical protein JSY10_20905 [Paenibacillus sp.]|nr:hypothetical protein [Paenibacillus sp.]